MTTTYLLTMCQHCWKRGVEAPAVFILDDVNPVPLCALCSDWQLAQLHAEKIRNASRWRGQAAGALCGECTPLDELSAEDRADPEFMRGYNETGHEDDRDC